MATYKPPTLRRKQSTRAGVPSQGGRAPYAPPAPALATAPPPPAQPTGATGTIAGVFTEAQRKANEWQDTSKLSPEQLARKEAVAPYFRQTGPRDILHRRIVGAAEDWLGLEQMLKERQAGEFGELTRRYSETAGREAGKAATGQVGAYEQGLRRRGTEFAGYAPAGEQAIRAEAAGRVAETMADFEAQVLAVQQQEIMSGRKGFSDFLSMALTEARNAETQKDLVKFSESLQGNSGWDQLMNVGGEIIGTLGFGPIGGAIGGAVGGLFGGGGGGGTGTATSQGQIGYRPWG